MVDSHPVTTWIARLKQGDERAPEAIWQAFFERLMVLARNKLGSLPKRIADEEDIALSAFNSFFKGVRKEQFSTLNDRDDLWKLLLVIAARKAGAQRRKHMAGKRPDAHFVSPQGSDADNDADLLYEAFGSDPTPETAAIFAEEYQRRLAVLPNDTVRQIVAWKLEGFTNLEIATKLNTYEVAIERKLRMIRSVWNDLENDSSES